MTTYPLPRRDDGDPRFTGELIDAVADLLAAHGYPAISDDDTNFARLRDALDGFLYGPENPAPYTPAQLEGDACVRCGTAFGTTERAYTDGTYDGWQLYSHIRCIEPTGGAR